MEPLKPNSPNTMGKINNEQITQIENKDAFSKGKVGKNLNHKTLSERGAYFEQYIEQYNGLKDVDDINKK